MGKLFQAVKKYYDDLLKLQNNQEKNFLKETKFANLYKETPKIKYLNFFINDVNKNARNYFGSRDEFIKFIKDNKDVFNERSVDIPEAYFKKDQCKIDVKSVDYEKILDRIEQRLGEKQTNALLEKFKAYNPEALLKETHPFKELTDTYKQDLNNLNLTPEKIKEYQEALDYSSDELIEKHEENLDDLIDAVSISRDLEATPKLADIANEVGVNQEQFLALKVNASTLLFGPMTEQEHDFLLPFANNQPVYTEEYKNKIMALDNLINEKQLIPNGVVGETDFKEYGFIDYFNKATELKELLIAHQSIDDIDLKAESLERISLKTKELKEVSAKYNDVIDFIKENFDLSKTALPGNVYAGRPHEVNDGNLNTYIPNLPVRWDKENAAYGVILNGFAQLKGAAKKAGVSIEEYMNNPIKSFYKGARNFFKEVDDKYYLPKDNNSLGKRIARAMVTEENDYTMISRGYGIYARGIEFLNATSDFDNNTLKNVVSNAAGNSIYNIYNHESSRMFANRNEPDYKSLQNIFALGNDVDYLYMVSTKFYDDNQNKGPLDPYYDHKIASMKNVNPLNETRRAMETIKDYLVERKNIYDEVAALNNPDLMMKDNVNIPSVFIASQNYLKDFIIKNNVNIFDLDKKQTKEIVAYLSDPISAFENKYRKNPNLFVPDLSENFNVLKQAYKAEHRNLYKAEGDKFISNFAEINNASGKLNAGKNIAKIIEDNQGGFWERNIGTTSKQYKAVEESILAASDPNSPTYGDMSTSKFFAEKYIAHKLPLGKTFDDLKPNEKRRVEFCQSIIATANKLEEDKIKDNDTSYIAPDNPQFQGKVKKDSDLGLETSNQIVPDSNELVNENIIEQQ